MPLEQDTVAPQDVAPGATALEQEPVPLEDVAPSTAATTRQAVMERPHPATPIIKGWMALVGLVVVVGRDALENLGKREGDSFGLRELGVFGGILLAYVVVTAVVGFFSWRFTRFVVDDHEVRIEHNFIQHNSDKIPFTKIQSVDVVQPFAARLLGLAQLRIDVGAGNGKTIEYLSRQRAYQMRDYLVTRARGRTVSVEESAAQRRHTGVVADVADDEQVLLRVPSGRLVLAAMLSSNFLLTLVVSLAGLAGLAWTQEFGAVVGIIPLLTALAGIIGNNVVKQWNYSLVRSGQALKVSRGMTSLVSQTLPTNRIQGIEVVQHQLWRPFGLYRVRMDVLGYGSSEADEAASDVLLPAGTWAEVERAIDAVWPGFRLADVEMHGVDPRVRRLHPFIWRSLQWGRNEQVFVARNGGFVHSTTVVHHARVQSVHLSAGPLQRRLGVADVRLDTTAGLLSACVAQELDEGLARRLVLEEMDLCRESRRRDAERAALDALPAPVVMPSEATVGDAVTERSGGPGVDGDGLTDPATKRA